MSTTHPIQRFIELREAVLKGWGEHRRKADQALRSSAAIAQAHYLLVMLVSLVKGIVTIVPFLSRQLMPWGLLAGIQPWSVYVLTLIAWSALFALPSVLIYGLKRTWLLLIYTLFGIPLLLAVSNAAAQ